MRAAAIGITCLVLAGGCGGRGEPAYEFSELAVPDAASTVASDLNDAGDVVGSYTRAGRTSGFVHKDGSFTTIEYPGAALTRLNGISEDGEIVGTYRSPDEMPKNGSQSVAFHGFLRTVSGDLLEVGHPDHKYTVAQRILPDGTVLGCFHDHDWTTTMRGVRIARSAIGREPPPASAFEVIDRQASMHNGSTPDGHKMVGIVMDTGEAYTVEAGVLRTFMAPEAKKTEAWDISPSGVIVGAFVDAASVSHGFVLENGRYTTLDVPGAKNTVAFGVNTRGDIVGGFQASDGQRRGFIAKRR